MNTIRNTIFTAFVFAIAVFSCKKNGSSTMSAAPAPRVNVDSLFSCAGPQRLDSSLLHDSLIGTWQWQYIRCFWRPEDPNNQEFKTLSVEFHKNDSLDVRMNGQVSTRSSWRLQFSSFGIPSLHTDPNVWQLLGDIVTCEKGIKFFASPVDGCDNYFKKIK